MDYKKIFKSRNVRLKLLELLSFIPDKTMLKIQYRIKTGRKLNLKNPQRFTEKLQWYKLNYKNPLMIQCVDKYDVREYVKSKGLESILVPCYGVYDSVDEINWDALPDQFVMKDTLAGGGISVEIIKDKKTADIEALKEKCRKWTSTKAHVKGGGREWPYYSGKNHRIIIEKFIQCGDGDLPDYKFFCFDGQCLYSYVKKDYAKSHDDGKLAFFDKDKKQLDAKMDYCLKLCDKVALPNEYDVMLNIAEKLSEEFPHARIDLYDVDGKIYFGEVTFYNASGYMKFEPDKFDKTLGEPFKIPRGGGFSDEIIISLIDHIDEDVLQAMLKESTNRCVPTNQQLIDYKFFCFNGVCKYMYVISDRDMGNGAALGIYDSEYNRIDARRTDERPLKKEIEKPENFDRLKEVAGILAGSFPEARVDLYDVNGQILFGEITFFDGSGYMEYEPDDFDFQMGKDFLID